MSGGNVSGRARLITSDYKGKFTVPLTGREEGRM